jgi:hypothetical protein
MIPAGKQQPTLKPQPAFERSLALLNQMMKSLKPVFAKSLALIDEMQGML